MADMRERRRIGLRAAEELARRIYTPTGDRARYVSALWTLDALSRTDLGLVLHKLRQEYVVHHPGLGSSVPPPLTFGLFMETGGALAHVAEFSTPSEAVEAGDSATHLGRGAEFVVLDSYMGLTLFDSRDPYEDRRDA